jgi:hypothetical protein
LPFLGYSKNAFAVPFIETVGQSLLLVGASFVVKGVMVMEIIWFLRLTLFREGSMEVGNVLRRSRSFSDGLTLHESFFEGLSGFRVATAVFLLVSL